MERYEYGGEFTRQLYATSSLILFRGPGRGRRDGSRVNLYIFSFRVDHPQGSADILPGARVAWCEQRGRGEHSFLCPKQWVYTSAWWNAETLVSSCPIHDAREHYLWIQGPNRYTLNSAARPSTPSNIWLQVCVLLLLVAGDLWTLPGSFWGSFYPLHCKKSLPVSES